MSFIGDVLGDILNPALGKPDPAAQEAATIQSTDLSKQLTGMSLDFYGKTAPLRDASGGIIDRATQFLQGNLDPTASAMYAPIKNSAERQYGTARDEIMSTMPTGGALYDKLGDLSAQKAGSMTDQIAKLVQDEYNKAYALASGSQTVAASGITNAGDSTNKLLQALATQQSAGAQQASNAGSAINNIASLVKYIYG